MTSEKATVPLLRAVAKGPVPSSMGPVDHPVRTRAAKLKASELVVDEDGVVRGKLEQDPKCTAFLLYDLEGELFFGAAPEPERYFDELTQRARAEGYSESGRRLPRAVRTHSQELCEPGHHGAAGRGPLELS
jgi:MFS superfamily sulfate permease-like transporter